MAEAAGSAPDGQLPGKAKNPTEKASGDVELGSSDTKPSTADSSRAAALKARKRTKTGCLTCRKRRIKCGEERPTCKNCVKSKRECEGYIPRVIFKDPLGAYRSGHHGIAVRTAHTPDHSGPTGMYGSMPSTAADTPIAPRLPLYPGQPNYRPIPTGSGHGGPGDYYSTPSYSYTPVSNGPHMQQYSPQGVPPRTPQHVLNSESFSKVHIDPGPYRNLTRHTTGESDSGIDMTHPDLSNGWSHGSESSTARSAETPVTYSENPNLMLYGQHSQDTYLPEAQETEYPDWKPSLLSPRLPDYPSLARSRIPDVVNHQGQNEQQFYGLHPQTPWAEEPEDDYFDVWSDDEACDIDLSYGEISSHNMGPLLAMSANQGNRSIRLLTNFLNEPNVLATYHPSYAASPLMDSHAAKVFCHFITATAPTLTVCERHPCNPTIIFSGVPVPKSQRSLWSYALPMLALTHQGLLHAMLALGSLHIAKLQQSSPTPSLKHYHYALRRVAKALGNPRRRKDVATLAATLLLGFYEVTTAEHNKWNSHLSGARELVMDIDFAGMAKKIEEQRCRQEEAEAKAGYSVPKGHTNGYHQSCARRGSGDFPAKEDRQLDENLISTIIGYRTKYNQYGQVLEANEPALSSNGPLTPQDIENYEMQCDLFWWYAKQDMIQSVVSGNRLLLSYDRWSLCPPRAPVGKLDAVYGSLDHLILLIGRVADFGSKDLPRKLRKQREAEKRSHSQSRSSGYQTTRASPQQGPFTMPNGMQTRPMYGMMPDPGPVRLPAGFNQAQHDAMYSAPVPSEDKSLETATYEAEAEWASITHAFDVFFEALGPAYAPLEPNHMPPMATPFGPALYYRSYAIACVLAMYYCGRIICMRVNPNMPPAAMAAAGVAARSTAQYANTIGRICAGIQPVDSNAPINPHHGAALMDCCMPLFQAGIQYHDPGQRGWIITKLRDVARLTGWQTSALIASGCERAWMRAAEMGAGPPYVRTMNMNAKDDRVAGRGRDAKTLEAPAKDNNDRRFITVNAGTRVYWALGILGVEEDMKGMKLD